MPAAERQGGQKRGAAIGVQKPVRAVPGKSGGQDDANRRPESRAARARQSVEQARRAPWNKVLQDLECPAGARQANPRDQTLSPAKIAQRQKEPRPAIGDEMFEAPWRAGVRSLGAGKKREDGDRRDAGESQDTRDSSRARRATTTVRDIGVGAGAKLARRLRGALGCIASRHRRPIDRRTIADPVPSPRRPPVAMPCRGCNSPRAHYHLSKPTPFSRCATRATPNARGQGVKRPDREFSRENARRS